MASTMRVPSMAQATRSAVARPSRSVRVVCQAQQKQEFNVKQVVAAAALASAMSLGCVEAAKADISGLTPCSKSKAFAKLEKKELKKLAQRKKQYEAGSAPALALDATAERTKARFATYAKANLLCGADGLPHLISEPGLALKYNHAGEVFIPTFGFLYIAGWIGNVGRTYLNTIRKDKPYEREIIIDVPLAIRLALQGAGWPLTVVQELQAGTLTEKQENITVSPR